MSPLQLQQAQNQLQQKEQEFIELRSGNDQSQQGLSQRIKIIEEQLYNVRLEIERITGLLNQKEQEIIEFERRCHEVESSVTYEIEEKTTKLRSKVEVWKSRFKKLNKEYLTCQETLIIVQAEINSINNGEIIDKIIQCFFNSIVSTCNSLSIFKPSFCNLILIIQFV